MRERLVELVLECSTFTPEYEEQARLHAEYVAYHLLAHGVIVPPCKVGDTVYCIRYDKARKPFIKPLCVLSVTMRGMGAFTVFTTKEDTIGKTAFLAREKAEEALAKMKGGAV